MALFGSFFKNTSSNDEGQFQFDALSNTDQLLDAVNESENRAFLIFKHSTSCSISAVILSKFKKRYKDIVSVKFFQLDLLKYRSLSNEIAEIFEVEHQSPQIILVKNKKVIHHASHYDINTSDLEALIASDF